MKAPLSRAAGLCCVALLAVLGGCAGFVGGFFYTLPGQASLHEVREYPLPHHIPKYEGGVSLRFAMVHDVIHERFPRHGEVYYRERNRLARKALADKGRPHDDAYFALFDDLGAGLDYLKQDDEAVPLLRDKLRQQEALGYQGRQLYTTYANLGTFLIHGNARAALSGDAAAKERMREGLSFIRKSIEVNPEAHFGREVWQAVAAEFLLAVGERPSLLLEYDMIGDSLAGGIDSSAGRSSRLEYPPYAAKRKVAAYLRDKDAALNLGDLQTLREQYITLVGAEGRWSKAVSSSHGERVPFDEPALGIIGMWRLGGGANPHFALALGEIMLRVGQRYIAWCAYERAAGLADRVWPDADIQRQFVEHCRLRQQGIERQLPANEVANLRPRFEDELAYGQRYQKAYQDYEAERIFKCGPLDDEQFYDDFNATHPPIASPVGGEEKFVAESDQVTRPNWPLTVLAAGVGAFVAACFVRFAARRQRGLLAAPPA
jgi:hypothetical protein